MSAQDLITRVASNLRTVRRRRGLSREVLGATAEVDPQMIKRIESGRANPALVVLSRLAAALGMSTEEFVRAVEQRQRQVEALRGGWHVRAAGVSSRLLASGNRSRVWELRLAPSVSYVEEPQLGAAEEIATAVRGEVRLEIDGTHHRLRRGDSLVLPMESARRFVNAGRATARLFRYQVIK
jgi:transcriptional regulator with XRE-family HTH domain